jgi:hypothetical protein
MIHIYLCSVLSGISRAAPMAAARLFVAAMIFANTIGVSARAAPPLEYQVKASYLYNFMQFVIWPQDVFGSDGKFNLCVVGADRFGSALNALETERIEERQITVRRLGSAVEAQSTRCHILFLAKGTGDTLPVGVVEKRGLLTIGEEPGILGQGGVINLVEVDGRIRFEINQNAAAQAGLTISSRLLRLAVQK